MSLFLAAPDDLPAAIELVNLAYRRTNGGARPWSTESGYIVGDRLTLPMLRADLERPGARLLLWRETDGAAPAGCVWLEPGEGGAWYLGMLTVHPDRQACGLGRRILEAGEAHAGALGAQRVRMTVVNVRDGLIAWYLRRGYTLTGEVLDFPYDDLRFGEPTRDDLSFVVLERALV